MLFYSQHQHGKTLRAVFIFDRGAKVELYFKPPNLSSLFLPFFIPFCSIDFLRTTAFF
jgi:hypothetical protein